MGFSGASLMIGFGLTSASGQITGYLLALGAAFIWSSYSLLVKKLGNINSATVGLFSILAGLCSLLFSAAFEPTPQLNQKNWLYIFLIGLGPLGLSFYTWNAALKKVDARVLGGLTYLTPLLSTLWFATFLWFFMFMRML